MILITVLLLLNSAVIYRYIRIRKSNRLIKMKTKELNNLNNKLSNSIKQLGQFNSTKDNFFYLMAHELKNPFYDLLEYSRNLTTGFISMTESEIQKNITILYQSSQNLYNLLENLLKYSTARSGNIPYVIEKIDLVNVITSEIHSNRINAERKQINVTGRMPVQLIIDSGRLILSIVIRNLIDNAIKFTPPGGKVAISATLKENLAVVEIDDSGPGIPEEMQKNLFTMDDRGIIQEYVRKEGKRNGLILCNEILEKIGGEIGVKSHPGQGSRFWFRLPLEGNLPGRSELSTGGKI